MENKDKQNQQPYFITYSELIIEQYNIYIYIYYVSNKKYIFCLCLMFHFCVFQLKLLIFAYFCVKEFCSVLK